MSEYAKAPDAIPAEPPAAPAVFMPVLLRRWPFLALGLVVGVGIGVLIHATAVPQYLAGAQVLIVKKRTELIKEGDMRVGSVDDYVATQVTLIRSEKIRLAAARQARTMPFTHPLPADDQTLAAVIGGGLDVSRDKEAAASPMAGSNVLNLGMRGGDPDDCRRLLEAVILAHKKELYTIYDQASAEKLATLERLADLRRDQYKQAAEEKIRLLGELRAITTEEVAGIRLRVTAGRTDLTRYATELVEWKDQLELIGRTGKNPLDRQVTLAQLTAQLRPTGLPAVAGDAGRAVALRRELEAEYADLAQTLGKDHPRLVALTAKIDAVKAEQTRAAADGKTAVDELGAYAMWADQKRKTAERLFAQTKDQLAADENKLKKAGDLQDRIEGQTAALAVHEAEIKRLEAEKITAQATQGAGGYALEAITPPAVGRKVAPVLFRSLAVGLVIGLLLGSGLMFLAEVQDQSFRSPADIRERLGMPVIGHVPALASRAAAEPAPASPIDPVLIAVHRPKSPEAEAYRGVRTQLFFSTQGRGHQVVQVTSPLAGDGKSTTAANLAAAIAQAGKRTILLDCDFRRPRVHKLFGLTGDLGLAGVIAGVDDLDSAVAASGVDNLHILPCGTRPANPAELLGSPQFQDVLTRLRDRYDFVIVDTPPVLAVTDPTIVAPRVDGVVLVVRMTKRVRPAAERAREILAAVGGHAIGVVVNASNFWGGGQAYCYSYGYKYVAYEAEGYHDDDEAAA